MGELLIIANVVVLTILLIAKTVRIVPQRHVFIIERLGKHKKTLDAGIHIILPFADRVAYKQTLKEQMVDVPAQTCITKDNISIEVDGVLSLQVVDPNNASYGIDNYVPASTRLIQTTLHSVIGKLELDQLFERRDLINDEIVESVSAAAELWGVQVIRFEMNNIILPERVRETLERQMCAEREKLALIAESEGERQAQINQADGEKQAAIIRSEGDKIKLINEAEGRAAEIRTAAMAATEWISGAAKSVDELDSITQRENIMALPSSFPDVTDIVASAKGVINKVSL